MADGSWTKKFAFYAASQCRLGNIIEAGFAAAVLFEKYIENELSVNGLKRTVCGDFLRNSIVSLNEHDNIRYNSIKLHALRKIRNRYIIHNDDSFVHYNDPVVKQRLSKDITKLVDFVWKSLDPQGVLRYRNIEAIPHIHADFAVMGVREFFQDNNHNISSSQKMILSEDFNDLIHMRRHFLQLGEFLQNGLLKKFKNLEVDLISHVDTSSGYVWLAINHIRPSPDHLRDRIRHSSASIFATPFDLRVSIDFGGEDYLGRQDYYKFLMTNEAKKNLLPFADFSIIDLEWYSFVTRCEPAPSDFTSQKMEEQLIAANELLVRYKNEGRIVTWERLLLGNVLPRESISYMEIAKRMERIIYLYFGFEKYRRDVLNRKNHLKWVPEGV